MWCVFSKVKINDWSDLKYLIYDKGCACCFFLFQQQKVLKKLWQKLFISSKTLFWFLRYSNFCNFLPSNILTFGEEVNNGIITMSWNLHKLSIVTFGITQKPIWIKALEMARWITKERKFLSIFGNLKRDW